MEEEIWQTIEQKGKPKLNEGSTEITILLLGETGVGKSTWINGFANFLAYDTLSEAEKSPTLCLIPSSFTMTDENYEERVISTGSDENECTEAGQSATQHPQSYIFPHEGNIIRLIDTPGIGDVRGVEQDKKNFELILNHISHLDNLNAICILLKPNNARLNIMFSFCIKELLTHLHRDACRNIVFCFTNSRSTFYRPGDTLPALRKLLLENKDVTIPLTLETLYCMDNESIRFLYALKDGINFTDEDRKNYNASWDKSVSEVNRLIKHACTETPHSIQNTLSLNNARHTILALGSPLAEITKSIQINIANGERQREELTTSQLTKEELSKKLIIKKVDVGMKMLDSPRTICTAPSCVEYVPVDDKDGRSHTKTNYKTLCHGNCSRGKKKNIKVANIVGHKSLKKCSAFNRRGDCKNCGCSYTQHMKITYETIMVTKEFLDVAKQQEIGIRESAIQQIEAFLVALDKHLAELRQEQQEITKASATFAAFLKKNAITPYNDALIAYLEHFINEERNKVSQGADPMLLKGMEEMRASYEKQMQILKEAMDNGKNDSVGKISTADLEKCIMNLYQLKHCGQNLRQMMNHSIQTEKSNYTEKRVERSKSFNTEKHVEKVGSGKTKLFKDIAGFFRTTASVSGPRKPAVDMKNRPLPPIPGQGAIIKPNLTPGPTFKPNPTTGPTFKPNPTTAPVFNKPNPTSAPVSTKPVPTPPLTTNKPKLGEIDRQSAVIGKPLLPERPKPPTSSSPKRMAPPIPQNIPKSTGGGPPPPPPPPPPPVVDQMQDTQTRASKSGSLLLDEIKQKQLKKITDGINLTSDENSNLKYEEKKSKSFGPMDDAMASLKKVLEMRAQRTHSEDDILGDDDFNDDDFA